MPSFTLDIARRYLFGKKSTNSINVITAISIIGISIGTAALILILSVFNGFEGLLSGLFNAFNPDIKVVPIHGKFFSCDDALLKKLDALPSVAAVSASIEEVALFEYKGVQEIGMIKGVDNAYSAVTSLDTLLVDGTYKTKEGRIHYGLVGIKMKNKLSLNVDDKLSPITVYMPAKKKSMLGTKDFVTRNLYPAGIFSVRSESDYEYVLTSYELASELLDKEGQVSFLEIKKAENVSDDDIEEALTQVLGNDLDLKDRYEQDETTLKVMRIEKWISFLITGLTMLLIAFNLLGALWMIGLDKKKDLSVLKALGLNSGDVRRLFIQLGMMITFLGILLGFVIALIIYYIQKQYGIIGVPDGFLMDAYPIQLRAADFLLVSATVFFIGFLASILPAIKAGRNLTFLRSN